MKRRGVILAIAAAAIVGAVAAGMMLRSAKQDAVTLDRVTEPSPSDGDILAEPFELFDGQVARLTDWQGTPLVVNFWASWCPPCVAEMREAFEPLHQEFGDRVAFIGLNLNDPPDRAHEIVERTGVTYTLGWDPAGIMFTGFGGFGMPTTVFIDADGDIVTSHTGALTRDQLRSIIQTQLDA